MNGMMDDKSLNTRYFTRLERVTKVTRTERGILAEVEGELLRVKISRGRTFDEETTFAVQA